MLDKIDNQTLIEVFIERLITDRFNSLCYQNKYVNFEYLRKLKSTKKLQSFNYNDEKVANICKKLFTKNIFDLRIMTPIDDTNLQELIHSCSRKKQLLTNMNMAATIFIKKINIFVINWLELIQF